MENTNQNRSWFSSQKKTALKLSLILVFFCAWLYYDSNASETEVVYPRSPKGIQGLPLVEGITSVKYHSNSIKVDTNFILKNVNKKYLLAELYSQELQQDHHVKAIPSFIQFFLDNISPTGVFKMADPGEEWQRGSMPVLEIKPASADADPNSSCDPQLVMVCKALPDKQLTFFALGKSVALLLYSTGSKRFSEKIVIVKFSGKTVTDFWFANYEEPSHSTHDILKFIERNDVNQGDGC